MKIVISESQYKRLIEAEEEQKVLRIPSLRFFNDDWFILEKFLDHKGNPPYSISEDLDLGGKPVKSLGNLQSVGGDLYLRGTTIKSLGNLQSVGGYLSLKGTPLSMIYNREQIREMVNVGGRIFL